MGKYGHIEQKPVLGNFKTEIGRFSRMDEPLICLYSYLFMDEKRLCLFEYFLGHILCNEDTRNIDNKSWR